MADTEFSIDAFIPPEMADRAEAVGIRKARLDFLTTFIAAGAIFATTVSAGAGTQLTYIDTQAAKRDKGVARRADDNLLPGLGGHMTFVRELLQGKQAGLWTIKRQATVYEALQEMADRNIGALPVVDDGELVGMFSERDYARKVILKGKSSQNTTVGELMSFPVFCVGLDETIETCMQLMSTQHIRHVPVCDNDQLVGMISIGDVLKSVIANQQVLIADLENFINGARS